MACVGLGQILGNPLASSAVSPFIARLEGGLPTHFGTAFGPGPGLLMAVQLWRRAKLVKDMIFDHGIGTQKASAVDRVGRC